MFFYSGIHKKVRRARAIKFIVLIALNFTIAINATEIYKWTDKNGKVHFSQNKPKEPISIESIKPSRKNKFVDVKSLSPIKNPIAKQQRHILVLRPDTFWTLKQPTKKTSTYFFGGDCVSPHKKSFKEMTENQPYLMPRVTSLIDYVVKPIIKLNYSVSSSRIQPLKHNAARYEQPLVLEFSLSDFKYDLCVTNLSRQYRNKRKTNSSTEPFNFSISEYQRRRTVITLKWRLSDPVTGEELFLGKTSGSANHWNRDIHKYQLKTIQAAMESATSNLFSNPSFVKSLAPKSLTKIFYKKKIPKLPEKNIFGSVGELFRSNAIKKQS